MSIEITVPVLPESVADALVLDWNKQVGDSVSRDEILIEVETDKVVLEVPAPVDGGDYRDTPGSRGHGHGGGTCWPGLKPAPKRLPRR